MGLFAVKNMRAMNASTEDITTHWLPSVRVLGDLRVGAITCRNVVRQHMLSETMAEKEAMEKTLATVVESNAKLRAQYEPMITSPEERALYKGWPDLWDKYKKGAFRDCGNPNYRQQSMSAGPSIQMGRRFCSPPPVSAAGSRRYRCAHRSPADCGTRALSLTASFRAELAFPRSPDRQKR